MKDKDLEDAWRIAKECENSMPDSGQFATSREFKSLVEREAAIEAYEWLKAHRGLAEYTELSQPDPPDVVFHFHDGTQFSIEVTTVAHEKTMQAIKYDREHNDAQGQYQDWTPELFQERILGLLKKKEARFKKHLVAETVTHPLALLFGSDGRMSGEWLIDGFTVTSDVFDEVLVHFGYVPNANPAQDNKSEYLIVDIFDRS